MPVDLNILFLACLSILLVVPIQAEEIDAGVALSFGHDLVREFVIDVYEEPVRRRIENSDKPNDI